MLRIAIIIPGAARRHKRLTPDFLGFPETGFPQVIGAIVERLGFRASSEKIGLELPLFTFELLDFLLECGDAFQGIAMATLPISDLLA